MYLFLSTLIKSNTDFRIKSKKIRNPFLFLIKIICFKNKFSTFLNTFFSVNRAWVFRFRLFKIAEFYTNIL